MPRKSQFEITLLLAEIPERRDTCVQRIVEKARATLKLSFGVSGQRLRLQPETNSFDRLGSWQLAPLCASMDM